MKTSMVVAALALSCSSAPGHAAVPGIATRQGELVCTGLLDIAFHGASAVQPPAPQVVAPIMAAYAFYIGRLNQAAPTVTKTAALEAAAKLTPQEKNAFGAECMKKSGQIMGAFLR